MGCDTCPGRDLGGAARDEDQEMIQYQYENTIELLRLLRFSETRNVTINFPYKMSYARNIKIENTTYTLIINSSLKNNVLKIR